MKNKETVRGDTGVEQWVIQLFSVHKNLYSEKPVGLVGGVGGGAL